MKRIVLVISLLIGTMLAASAQNNPYAIDDKCYEYLQLTERLLDDLSHQAFEKANEALLKRAHEVNDRKAECIYYTNQLKRTTRLQRNATDRIAANKAVDEAREKTLKIAWETGYKQYYYYAYEVSLNYYINTKQDLHAQQLMQDMMTAAKENNDEYGLWRSQYYMGTIFLMQKDYLNARTYLRQVVETYRNTTNPDILNQSITRYCCDLADTYPVASDSARLYYRLAEDYAELHIDTLRCRYYQALMAAYDKKPAEYRRYRDYCLRDPLFPGMMQMGAVGLRCVDDILKGASISLIQEKVDSLARRQQMMFIRQLALDYKRNDVALLVDNRIIEDDYAVISRLNTLRAGEISAELENNELSIQLINKDLHIRKITILVLTLLLLLMSSVVVFSLIYIRNLKKTKEKNNTL